MLPKQHLFHIKVPSELGLGAGVGVGGNQPWFRVLGHPRAVFRAGNSTMGKVTGYPSGRIFLPWASFTTMLPHLIIVLEALLQGKSCRRNRELRSNITVYKRFVSSTSSLL